MAYELWQYAFTGTLLFTVGAVQTFAPAHQVKQPRPGVTPTKLEIATRAIGVVIMLVGLGAFLSI